jgi:8-oxo-dGTP diphosphatase
MQPSGLSTGDIARRYPTPALTVDVVIFCVLQDCLQVLLIQRGREPFRGLWALPGGFVEIDEALDDAALRELQEETGLSYAYLEQLYTYGDPGRDPRGRVVSVAYFALAPRDAAGLVRGGSDASHAAWFPVDALPSLSFDHGEIMAYALRRLRYKLEYSAVGFELLPEAFTLSEIQRVYEMILGEKLDKRNFRRRIQQAGIIEPIPERRAGERRPAQLYRYREDAVAEVKARRLFP